jgi:rod shape-determining protein MreC
VVSAVRKSETVNFVNFPRSADHRHEHHRGGTGTVILARKGVQKLSGQSAGSVLQACRNCSGIFLHEENTMLRQKLEDYLRLQNEVAELKKKQSELEKLVDYTEEWKEDYVVAQVVARSPDRFNDVIVIDRGREDGIRPNMPVITPEGLIGRIESVTDSMANVQLLTSSRSEGMLNAPAIAAEVRERDAFGIIEGYDHEKEALILSMIDSDVELKEGDTVVTYHQSEIYPPNLLIGTVEEVGAGIYGLDKMAFVKPTASFHRLQYVMVVQDSEKIEVQEHLDETDRDENGGD